MQSPIAVLRTKRSRGSESRRAALRARKFDAEWREWVGSGSRHRRIRMSAIPFLSREAAVPDRPKDVLPSSTVMSGISPSVAVSKRLVAQRNRTKYEFKFDGIFDGMIG